MDSILSECTHNGLTLVCAWNKSLNGEVLAGVLNIFLQELRDYAS